MVKNELGNSANPVNEKDGKKKRSGRFRWVKWLFCVILILLSLPVLVFQFPQVQNYAAKQLTDYLSEDIGTEVSIGTVKLNVFYEFRLEKFYLEDLQGDTLIYAGLIDVDYSRIYRLLNKEMEIESLTLDDAIIYISREAGEEFSNYQFLVDYFTPDDKDKKIDRDASPFILNLRHLLLTNVHFNTPDGVKGETIDVHAARIEAYIEEFDLLEKSIKIGSLNIDAPDVILDQYLPQPLDPNTGLAVVDAPVETEIAVDTLNIFVKDLVLSDGTFKLSNRRKEPVKLTEPGTLNLNHLDVFDINFNFKELAINDELEFEGIVARSSLRERNGFVLENLAAKEAALNCNGLALFDMELRTPQTLLGDTLIFKYEDYYDWETFPDDVKMDLRFSEKAYVSLQDIMTFAPALKQNPFFKENEKEEVNITGRILGPISRLDGRKLRINLAGGVLIEGDFSTIGLNEKDEQFLYLELDRMRSDVKTLRKLIPGFTPPENFDRLGNLDFSGNFNGFFVDFVANGQLKTDIGSASMDVNMKLQDGREKALYAGDLRLNEFDLGIWSGNDDFGKISFSAAVKEGVGLSLNTAEAKVAGHIDSLLFKDYAYTNVQIDGELKKNLFNGDLLIEDEHAHFSFGGEVNFTDTIPTFDFKTDIRQLSLKDLNLSEKDLQFSGKAALQLAGKRLSDVVGEAEVTDFQVVKNYKDTLYMDKATVLSAVLPSGEKDFKLVSNLGNLDIQGRFDIEKIPNAFVGFLHDNYPRFANKLKIKPSKAIVDTMVFDYKVELFELQNLVSFFNEKINGFDQTILSGSYDGIDGDVNLEVEIPKWSYENISFDDVYVRSRLNREDGSIQLGVVETALNNGRKLSPISVIGTLYADTMEFLVISSNFFKILDNININGILSLEEDEAWRVSFKQSDLAIMNQLWNIDTTNYIRIGGGRVETQNFSLYNGDQRIILKSFQQEGLELLLRNIPLQSIDFIRNVENHKAEGVANLDVRATNVFKLKGLSTFLEINDLKFNGDDYGRLELNGRTRSIKDPVSVDLSIIGDTTSFEVDGFVNLPSYEPNPKLREPSKGKNYFDFQVDMDKVPVHIVSYFVPAVLNPGGSLTGSGIHLYGPFSKPELKGILNANNISFKVKALQTTYRVPSGSVILTSNAIDATGSFALDRFNNRAYLNGGIVHDHLKDFGLNLTISTEPNQPFLGLETTEADNSVFYGTALGTGWARFTGSFRQTDLDVRGRSMPGTHMFLPLTSSTISQDNRFIRFTEEQRKQEELVEVEPETAELRGLNMYYDLEITPDAIMEVIFDKAWGDVLSGTGSGNIQVELLRSGHFEMHGNIEVVSGDYLFTLMNVGVNKPFSVAPGGTVVWTGDPYNADINIDALYSGVSTSVYNLIQEYINVASDETKNLARSSTDVLLAMNLSGKLLTPDIKFDISFPDLDSELKSFADNKLRAMRQDENELNRQVFGLLVLSQFLPSGSSIQAQDVGLNTLSEMLSNQLSIFVTEWVSELVAGTNFIKGIDVNFSVNRFTTEDLTTADLSTSSEVGGKVKVILSDKVAVNLGTEYGLNSNNVATINGGQWAGEFDLEWSLTKDRRLVFKAYSEFDPDITGGRRNKYGGKFIYRKEFDSWNELINFSKKKKKKGKK